MKCFKKVVALLCSICTIMTMSLPAFAVEFENKGNNTDIQFKKIMESVYEQLVAQNAEDMYPVYEEIISAQYYNQLALTKKGPVSTLGDEDEVYRYAPYGGSVTYKLPREWGVEPLRVGMLCLDGNKTGKYVIDLLASGDSFNAYDMLGEIIGMSSLSYAMSVFNVIGKISDKNLYSKIKENDYCAMVISTMNYIDGSKTSVIYAWESHFWMCPPTNAFDLEYEIFKS